MWRGLVYDLRAKLDGSGHYDDFEVDRVVAVEMNPKAKQGDLIAALEPVADRLLKRFKQAQEKRRIALAKDDAKAAEEAKGEMDSLALFKNDLGAFQGNTAIEKRFIFYKRLLPLLEFGREREGIDLSKVILTHHSLKDQGKRQLILGDGESPKLQPLTEAGAGSVQEKEKARLEEIIAKVNDLFEGDLTDDDRLVYVNNVIKGKLLASQELVMQASNNTKAQFANSPTLSKEIMNAVARTGRSRPGVTIDCDQ
jgi:type I restriction enzyme, R subunit